MMNLIDERMISKVEKSKREQHIQEIMRGEYPEEDFATLGENRGQLFVRIPKLITNRMKLKKGQKVKFVVTSTDIEKNKLEIEVLG